MNNTKTPTWAEIRNALPAGLPELAVEAIRREGAAQRHTARIRAAMERAIGTVGGKSLHLPNWAVRPVAGIWCHIEARGLLERGGEHQLSTARANWAQHLGNGRREALDGDAWTAAIDAAGTLLMGGRGDYHTVALVTGLGDPETGLRIEDRGSGRYCAVPIPEGPAGERQYWRAYGARLVARLDAQKAIVTSFTRYLDERPPVDSDNFRDHWRCVSCAACDLPGAAATGGVFLVEHAGVKYAGCGAFGAPLTDWTTTCGGRDLRTESKWSEQTMATFSRGLRTLAPDLRFY